MTQPIPIGSTDPDAVIHGIPRIALVIGATVRRTQWLSKTKDRLSGGL